MINFFVPEASTELLETASSLGIGDSSEDEYNNAGDDETEGIQGLAIGEAANITGRKLELSRTSEQEDVSASESSPFEGKVTNDEEPESGTACSCVSEFSEFCKEVR